MQQERDDRQRALDAQNAAVSRRASDGVDPVAKLKSEAIMHYVTGTPGTEQHDNAVLVLHKFGLLEKPQQAHAAQTGGVVSNFLRKAANALD